jgi:hypothetical protein
VQLLPESYAALIYAHMELSPPDVAVAKALYGALPGTGSELQAPWAVLCRLLSAKDFAADAVAAVREGLEAGLLLDADVGEAYIKALCDTEQPVSDVFFSNAKALRCFWACWEQSPVLFLYYAYAGQQLCRQVCQAAHTVASVPASQMHLHLLSKRCSTRLPVVLCC